MRDVAALLDGGRAGSAVPRQVWRHNIEPRLGPGLGLERAQQG
jgi:hypothetical protein